MKLKTAYATFEDIPEGYGDLYTERNGQFELTGIEGVKTQADIDRIQNALVKERKDHKIAKEALQAFGDLDPAAVHEKLESYDSLQEQIEALKTANPTDEQMEPLIQARVKQAIGPLEREKVQLQRKLDDAQHKLGEKDQEVVKLNTHIVTDRIERSIRDAAGEAKLLASAISDAVMRARQVFEYSEDGRIITKDTPEGTPGLSPKEWLKEMQEKAPHWWPTSVGTGALGGGPSGNFGGANNPWSREGWNLTKQGQYLRQHGEEKAKTLAERVGSKVGATKPPAAA